MSLVSFEHAENLDYDSIKAAIERSLANIKFNFRRKIKKLVIKPNMCYYIHPSTGDVTHPCFVSALIDVLRENFAVEYETFIVESDASAMKCRYCFRMLGYDKMAEEKGAKLVNLSQEQSRIVEVRVNNSSFKFYIPEIFYEADFVVNVPKIKYMSGSKITCALKNIFGCNAFAKKSVYHKELDNAIVGINKLVKTNLVVVDGLIVCGKSTKRLDMVMASEDPVAVDSAASKMLGINPNSVGHILTAANEGIGKKEFLPIGDFVYFKTMFPKRSFKDNARASVASVYMRLLK